MKKINKKQVAEILGVHTKSLSRWGNEKIKYELAKACYKVIDIAKEGRSIYFYIEYEEYAQRNDEFLGEVFKVKDIRNLKMYTRRKIQSIEKKELITRKELCSDINVAIRTSKRYDKKLIENGVFQKLDDEIYICVNKETKERVLVNREAYNNFWRKDSLIKKELKSLAKRYAKKEFSLDDYNYLRDIIMSKSDSKNIYYKVNKIVIKYDNYLYNMLMEEDEKASSFLLGNSCGPLIRKYNGDIDVTYYKKLFGATCCDNRRMSATNEAYIDIGYSV